MSYSKRLIDILLAVIGLVFIWPILLVCAVAVKLSSPGPVLYLGKRTGRYSIPFKIFKFRSMREDAERTGGTTTGKNDTRITSVGKFLRKYKLDELPQLLNVLIGQMSIVGPRPDVPGYANQLKDNDRIILTVRPGITGPAQIAYRHEEDMLSSQTNPMEFNNQVIWPDKVRINREYVENYSFLKDIFYIWATIKR